MKFNLRHDGDFLIFVSIVMDFDLVIDGQILHHLRFIDEFPGDDHDNRLGLHKHQLG